MANTRNDKIEAVQRLNDGNLITLGKDQFFCESEKTYSVWQEKPELRRVMSVRKSNVGFVRGF